MNNSLIAKNTLKYRMLLEKAEVAEARPSRSMLTEEQWEVTAEQLRLTRREKEVCKELFDGYTRNEIADHLGIKPRTVRHYMEHIHQKLAVSNRVGVVLRLIQIRDKIAAPKPELPPQQPLNGESPQGPLNGGFGN